MAVDHQPIPEATAKQPRRYKILSVDWMMKRCINCGITKPKCFLCRDCWRVAIISPLIVGGIEVVVYLICR